MMPAGVISCWSGDRTTNDALGLNNAAPEGNVTYATGLFGQAFSFDGQSSVVAPDSSSLDLTNEFTFSAWISPSALMSDPQYGGLISKVGGSGGGNGYQFGLVGQNTAPSVLFNEAGQAWPGYLLNTTLPSAVPVNSWTHIAASYDHQTMKLYVNGVVVAQQVIGAHTIVNSASKFRISGDDNNNVRFKGLMDEVAVFGRALSDSEISSLAQPPLRIVTPETLPNAALGQSYTQTVTAAGGVAPYFYSLASGSLPSGLSLSSDGVISGTTSRSGAYTFVVKVEDAGGHANDISYAVTVIAPGAAPSISVTSDGRLGAASRFFFDNYAVNYYINTDNGVIYQQYSNYPWEAYTNQPESRVISQPNGPDIRVLEFTTFDVNLGGSALTIVGSKPLIIATQGDVTIRGNIRALNNGGVGGSRPEGNFDTGIGGGSTPGSMFANGGGGGWGAAYVFSSSYTPFGWDILSAAGGGGGGSAANGATGGAAYVLHGSPLPPNSAGPGPAGSGGQASTADVFQGGGGGGQGGYAHTWYCCYTGGNGANGGGALMFQSGGNVLIHPNSSVVADGVATPFYQGEVGGGGAGGGGYLLFDAAGTFDNRGILSSRGGAGTTYTSVMSGTPGAGGRVVIRRATAAANTGIIDVNGGNEASTLGGEFINSGLDVSGGGQVKGIGSNVLTGALTTTGVDIVTTGSFGSVTFPTVSSNGATNIAPIDSAVARTGGALPPHYTDTGLAFEVSTTASYSGPVTSCFYAPSITTAALFNRLRVLHLENGVYVDRTILSPSQPAPHFASHTICSSTLSLSPFILALVDEVQNQHLWHADYNLDFFGARTNADAMLNGNYQFQYDWHIGIFNDPTGPLDDATITVAPAIAGVVPSTSPDNQTLPMTWTRQVAPSGSLQADLGGGINVPALTELGYDVSRQLVGGRTVAAGATEARTFTVQFVSHDAQLTHLGALINFNGTFANGNGPIVSSNVTCSGPGLHDAPSSYEIHWQVGDNGTAPEVTAETTYLLTCSVTLTNTTSLPVSYTPVVMAEGQIRYAKIVSGNPTTYTSTASQYGPADPLGLVTWSTSTPGTLVDFDQRFQRTVVLDGSNAVMDVVAPVTTWSLPPTATGWYNAPSVSVSLTAADPQPGSGFKRMTYTLSGAENRTDTFFGPNAGVQISAEGITTVTVQSEDNAGNLEQPQSFVVKIDRHAPVTTHTTSTPANAQNWFNAPVTVTLHATDDRSDVKQIAYTLTPAGQQPGAPVVVNGDSATFTVSTSSNLNYFSVDNAGNGEQNHGLQINIDSTAPSTNIFTTPGPSVVIAGQNWWNTNVSVNINANDNCNSGPCSSTRQIWYSLSGAQTSALTAISGSFASALVSAEGSTTVTYYAEDNAGNTSAPSVFVVNVDKSAPAVALNAPSSILEGQLVTLTTTVTDASSNLTYQWTPPSNGGTLTPNGATATYIRRQPGSVTVSVRVSDGHGNATTRQATIQVLNVAPSVSAPASGSVQLGELVQASGAFSDPGNDGPYSAQVNFGDATPVQMLPITFGTDGRSGTFVLAHTFMTAGDFVVTVSVTDNFGATGSNVIAVHVEAPDTTPPTMVVHDITVTATQPQGIPVDYTVTATDDRGSATVACSPTSGSVFVIGDTTVSCTATDDAGNSATATFTVSVRDGVAPSIEAPSVAAVEATSTAGATVTFTPMATDNVAVTSTTCLPSSGSTFAIGTTDVTCTARDGEGNTAATTFAVTVVDSTAPQITVPSTVTATAISGVTAIVSYSATATDTVDGALTPTCTPASGSAFPLGSTSVTCNAIDAHGNQASASFVVRVNDGAAPIVTVSPAGPRVVEATSADGAVVTFAATATDNLDSAVLTSCSPASGSTFALGVTTVTCTATDNAGNIGSASFTVTVVDTTAPQLMLPAQITASAGASGTASVTFSASAIDLVDGTRTVTCAPASGSTFAIGQTLVTCTASDTRGNAAMGTFGVTVVAHGGAIGRFVAFSKDGTWLRPDVTVVSGDVGANERRAHQHDASDDDDLDRRDTTVTIGERVKMQQPASRVVGDVVRLMNRASVYDVIDNALFNQRGNVLGSITNTMALPYLSLPSFATASPGTTEVDVKKNTTRVLSGGAYGRVHVAQGATLVLSGGVYQMLSLDVEAKATVLFRGPSELRIKTELDADSKAQLILDQAVAGLKASQMVIYVEGVNASCRHDGHDEDGNDHGGASVHIGEQGVVQANIYALNGTVWLKAKAQATGAFIGEHVRIGKGVTLTLDSAWR